jgi:hypothetical protein
MIKQRSEGPAATPQPALATTQPAAPVAAEGGGKDAAVRERIGHQLRALFEDVVAEPVPERFQTLLDELARKSRKP